MWKKPPADPGGRPTGRPQRKLAMTTERRTVEIGVRLTRTEKNRMIEKAGKLGISLGDLIVFACDAYDGRRVRHDIVKQMGVTKDDLKEPEPPDYLDQICPLHHLVKDPDTGRCERCPPVFTEQ